MKGWWVTDPWIFYGTAGAIVAYVLYMMIRKRKGERSGVASRESRALRGKRGGYPACSGIS